MKFWILLSIGQPIITTAMSLTVGFNQPIYDSNVRGNALADLN